MVTIHHRRLPARPTLGQLITDSTFLERLSEALYAGTHQPGCAWCTGRLYQLGVVRIADKAAADAFVSWLRALCGGRFDTLIEVECKPNPKVVA